MKRILLLGLLIGTGLGIGAATAQEAAKPAILVALDALVAAPESWGGQLVAIDGQAAHICPVEGMKLKLKSDAGKVVNVVPGDGKRFDPALAGHQVRVTGTVEIRKVFAADLQAMEATTWIPCHVDLTPCKDKAYVENLDKLGKRAAASREQIGKIRQTMKDAGRDYVVVVTLVATHVESLP